MHVSLSPNPRGQVAKMKKKTYRPFPSYWNLAIYTTPGTFGASNRCEYVGLGITQWLRNWQPRRDPKKRVRVSCCEV
jgi:hypothetical protein